MMHGIWELSPKFSDNTKYDKNCQKPGPIIFEARVGVFPAVPHKFLSCENPGCIPMFSPENFARASPPNRSKTCSPRNLETCGGEHNNTLNGRRGWWSLSLANLLLIVCVNFMPCNCGFWNPTCFYVAILAQLIPLGWGILGSDHWLHGLQPRQKGCLLLRFAHTSCGGTQLRFLLATESHW